MTSLTAHGGKWHVESSHFDQANPSELKIYRFLHLIAGEATQSTATGAPYSFRILAVLDRNLISGKWMDPLINGYYGTFQLMLSHTRDSAKGMWVGFSSTGVVKGGEWTWTPVASPETHK